MYIHTKDRPTMPVCRPTGPMTCDLFGGDYSRVLVFVLLEGARCWTIGVGVCVFMMLDGINIRIRHLSPVLLSQAGAQALVACSGSVSRVSRTCYFTAIQAVWNAGTEPQIK